VTPGDRAPREEPSAPRREGASTIVVDRGAWGRLRVTGADRERFLQGLTTVNVPALGDGEHAFGAILSPKGRVLSVIDIAREPDALRVACEPALAEPTRALLEKYAVMDDVAFHPVAGPAHQTWGDPWRAPIVEGAFAGALRDDDPLVERARVRAGFLRYGVDVDDDHFPFETPLGALIDYGKGCYVGQEPVFRVHAQGNAARALRGFVVDGDAPLARGAPIVHPARERAGAVTSAVAAGDGTTLALGYLHRTVWEPGAAVTIDGRRAIVKELPF
jgi:folate-binding protein YgfZ